MTGQTWTTDQPTKPGWYWYRFSERDVNPEICRLTEDGEFYKVGEECSYEFIELTGLWAGPLDPPR